MDHGIVVLAYNHSYHMRVHMIYYKAQTKEFSESYYLGFFFKLLVEILEKIDL